MQGFEIQSRFGTKRRSQRAQAAIDRILPATLEIVDSIGLHETSISRVSERAGMSRGAVLHHYKTKLQLIVAAYEHLLVTQLDQIGRVATKVSDEDLTFDDFMTDLWGRYSGPLLMVTLDYLSVARTNDELRAEIIPLALKFNMGLNDIWQRLFANSSTVGTTASTYLNLTLCVARGMGVQSIWRNETAYFDTIFAEWKNVLEDRMHDAVESAAG